MAVNRRDISDTIPNNDRFVISHNPSDRTFAIRELHPLRDNPSTGNPAHILMPGEIESSHSAIAGTRSVKSSSFK